MKSCPCQSNLDYSNCCEPFLIGKSQPKTAEQLMRSRYTAFAVQNVDYLEKTLAPESRADFDKASTAKWAKEAQWKGLKILKLDKGQAEDKKGTVEFVATYTAEGETLDHHEVAEFRQSDTGQWYFIEGDSHTHKEGEGHHHAKPETVVREEPKIGRNDPCVCGSGKKYKKCCAA